MFLFETNKYLRTKTNFSELYGFLRCQFFMKHFDGITGQMLWWNKTLVSLWVASIKLVWRYATRTRCFLLKILRIHSSHGIRLMEDTWNAHCTKECSPALFIIFGKPMNVFFGQWVTSSLCGDECRAIAYGTFPHRGRPVIWHHKNQEGKDGPKRASNYVVISIGLWGQYKVKKAILY